MVVSFPRWLSNLRGQRDCERLAHRIGRMGSSLWDGNMFQAFTPDGELTDVDHESLVEEMYDFQEALVGYLSYWPNISVAQLISFATWAEKIERELPEHFVITRESILEFKALIAESAPKLEQCLGRQNPGTQGRSTE